VFWLSRSYLFGIELGMIWLKLQLPVKILHCW
jgi:hypothetical protein